MKKQVDIKAPLCNVVAGVILGYLLCFALTYYSLIIPAKRLQALQDKYANKPPLIMQR